MRIVCANKSGWDEVTRQAGEWNEVMFEWDNRTWFAVFTLDGKLVRITVEGNKVMRKDLASALMRRYGAKFEDAISALGPAQCKWFCGCLA